MLSDMVLDVERYPAIAFESTGVTAKGPAAAARPDGHGQDDDSRQDAEPSPRPFRSKSPAIALTATGKFVIKQTDFGITPISVGGVVKVKDELNITFTVVARER